MKRLLLLLTVSVLFVGCGTLENIHLTSTIHDGKPMRGEDHCTEIFGGTVISKEGWKNSVGMMSEHVFPSLFMATCFTVDLLVLSPAGDILTLPYAAFCSNCKPKKKTKNKSN